MRRPLAIALALAALGGLVPCGLAPVHAAEAPLLTGADERSAATPVDRLAGPDRIATALAVARRAHPHGSATVVLAAADHYPDALAGAPLAAVLTAPLLLTEPGRLTPAVGEYLTQVGVRHAVLLGGEQALSTRVVRDLRQLGVSRVRRIAGTDRMGTAARVAEEVLAVAPGQYAYLALGGAAGSAAGWADALAVSSLAAASRRPVLLTAGDHLPAATRGALTRGGIRRVVVVGGPAAVSEPVLEILRRRGLTVTRLAGPDRYATSTAVADALRRRDPGRTAEVWVATGHDWPDALAAGPGAAAAGGLLLLVDGRRVEGSPPAEAWLAAHRDRVQRLTLVGGARSVTPLVAEALQLDLVDPARIGVRATRLVTVSQLTGPGSANATPERWGVHGTDLGHTFMHRGRMYMVFGDTFGPGHSDWRSNTMARLTDLDPRDGLTFAGMITDRPGHAKELLPSRKDPTETTVIPTYGFSDGRRMFLHYMSVRRWGEPGHWEVRRSGLAYSDDDGRTWTKAPRATWPEGSGFAQAAVVRRGEHFYLFGIPAGRSGGVRLARVPVGGVLDPDRWEYWDGASWIGGDEREAVEIVPRPVGELSVRYSPYLNRWLMTYLDHDRYAVVLRTAPKMIGPWGAPRVMATGRDYPQLYSPYLLPDAGRDRELYMTLSRFDTYNVYLTRLAIEPVVR